MNARTVLAIAWKDILDAVNNRYLLMSLVMPVGLSLFFQLIFGGGLSNLATITIAVHDRGGSRLVSALRDNAFVKIVEAGSVEELKAEVDQTAAGGLDIPADFDKNVDAGNQPELTVYVSNRQGGNSEAAFRQLVTQQVWAMREKAVPAKIVWTEWPAAAEASAQSSLPSNYFFLVLFLVMSMTMAGGFVVPLLLVEEKEKHTMEFLLVSPATPAEIAAGKAITGMVYCLLGAGILIALNRGWAGNWPLTFLAVFLGALFLVGVGLLMGSVLNTAMQVNGWSTIVLLGLLAPSWLSIPSLPPFLTKAMRFIPTFYLVEILEQSLADTAAVSATLLDLGILAACVAVTFALLVWAIRRQQT